MNACLPNRSREKSTLPSSPLGKSLKSSVVILKKITHLPVIVDPSHAVGNYNFVSQMALAAVSVGADGVMIEVHDNPVDSASDAYQAYKLSKLKTLIEKGREIKDIISK